MTKEDSYYISKNFLIFGQYTKPQIIELKEINNKNFFNSITLNENYKETDKTLLISKLFFDSDYQLLYRLDKSLLISPNEDDKITINFESFVNLNTTYNLIFSTNNERKICDLNIVHKDDGNNNLFSLSIYILRVLISKYKKLYIFPIKEFSKMSDEIVITPISFY